MGAGSLFLLVATIGMILSIVLGIIAVSKGRAVDDGFRDVITVTGNGEVTAVPDIATVNFTIRKESDDIAEAQAQATEQSNTVIEAIRATGIDESDIKTDSYSSYPKYEWRQDACRDGYCGGRQELVGYEVTHSISVKIRDLAKVGDMLALLGEQKVDNISGPNFTIDDDRDLQAEARDEAIAEAKIKAGQLAQSLGVKLGKVVDFYENNGYGGPVPLMYKGGVAMDATVAESVPARAPELPTGENTVATQVTVTYKIR